MMDTIRDSSGHDIAIQLVATMDTMAGIKNNINVFSFSLYCAMCSWLWGINRIEKRKLYDNTTIIVCW
uniref:Uncharacterized protein n=1 Tax=Pyramimonas orientalis virus TaxID=455367 RepID=A0A7M3UNV0_POV01|nr:hypothetical protein HWQ62_00250 [Pyramimonas orientalis virus]